MHDDAVARLRNTVLLAGAALITSAAVAAPKINVITVIARDFSFELPASIPAGLTTFHMLNKGKQEHHMSVFRLDSGKTAAEGIKALVDAGQGPRPAWLRPVGGPQAARSHTAANATLVLEPGSYLVFCEVPGPDPMPHFMKGMAKGFTVTGASHPSPLPKADVNLTLTEYDFTFTQPLTRGRHTVAVTNTGAQAHMVVITRLPPGQSSKPWMDWAMNPQGKSAPGQSKGGVTEIPPGATVNFTENFTPGRYFLICFTADAMDGKPHFLHGMQKEIVVR